MEFSFDGKTVRAVSVDGQNWFYANELCAVLQHSNPREAISSLDDDEKGVRIADTPGGKQKVNVVNEAGLYHLVLMSRMPRAKNFRRWVTHEVVPSIRRRALSCGCLSGSAG